MGVTHEGAAAEGLSSPSTARKESLWRRFRESGIRPRTRQLSRCADEVLGTLSLLNDTHFFQSVFTQLKRRCMRAFFRALKGHFPILWRDAFVAPRWDSNPRKKGGEVFPANASGSSGIHVGMSSCTAVTDVPNTHAKHPCKHILPRSNPFFTEKKLRTYKFR